MYQYKALTLWLEIVTPSQNQWDKWHWGKQERWKKSACLVLRSAVNKAGGRSKLPLGGENRSTDTGVMVSMKLTRLGPRKLDYGNLVGGAKGLVDVLKLEGLIVDDSDSWIADDYDQKTERKQSKQGIRLELSWSEEQPDEEPETQEPVVEPVQEVRTMKMEQQDVELRKVEIVKAYKDDAGKDLMHVRVHLTAQEMSSKDIPFVSSAVAELVKEAADVEDGPNTVNVSIKRDFGVSRYVLTDEGNKRFRVAFSGEPVNQVRAPIVEGVVALRWCVEDTAMDGTTLKKLAARVACQGLILDAAPAQSSIPFEAGEQLPA